MAQYQHQDGKLFWNERRAGQYEYKELVIKRPNGKPLAEVSAGTHTKYEAMIAFWAEWQQAVWKFVKEQQDQGWEPITEIGPSSLVIANYPENEPLGVRFLRIFLWQYLYLLGIRMTFRRKVQ